MRFADALDRDMEDIVQPPNAPVGNYIWVIKKHPTTGELAGGEWDKLSFVCGIISACEDVDEDELKDYGMDNLQGTIVTRDFLFPTSEDEELGFDKTLNFVKMFLGHCGVDADEGKLNAALASSVGATFMGKLEHQIDKKNPEVTHMRIMRTAPVE